nr:uncharacterized protein LOC128696067 isoform X1 [Cherax quadricarinatus]
MPSVSLRAPWGRGIGLGLRTAGPRRREGTCISSHGRHWSETLPRHGAKAGAPLGKGPGRAIIPANLEQQQSRINSIMDVKLILLVQAVAVVLFADVTEAECKSGQIECRTGGKCISLGSVCRSNTVCEDGSDKDPEICRFWTFDRNHCGDWRFNCGGRCYYIHDICSLTGCEDVLDPRVCKLVKSRKLSLEPEGMQLDTDMLTLLDAAVNTTLSRKAECPMLYTRVHKLCLAFFSPAKLSWPEAKQFCHSIYGELFYFKNLSTFAHLLTYMREALLTTDYWIGGRYDLDTNAWSWVTDDSIMPLGSPYWAVKYNKTCVPRPPPQTDPFSDPPEDLPGAPCYNYIQSPTERVQGWCAALTYKHFYYVSDEVCQEKHSPLCVLTDRA